MHRNVECMRWMWLHRLLLRSVLWSMHQWISQSLSVCNSNLIIRYAQFLNKCIVNWHLLLRHFQLLFIGCLKKKWEKNCETLNTAFTCRYTKSLMSLILFFLRYNSWSLLQSSKSAKLEILFTLQRKQNNNKNKIDLLYEFGVFKFNLNMISSTHCRHEFTVYMWDLCIDFIWQSIYEFANFQVHSYDTCWMLTTCNRSLNAAQTHVSRYVWWSIRYHNDNNSVNGDVVSACIRNRVKWFSVCYFVHFHI